MQTRLSCRTSITAQEMMTASYYCLMDDMEFSFASHLHHTGVISKAVEEEVDQLYRLQGPQVAVRKLTEVHHFFLQLFQIRFSRSAHFV